MFDVPNETADYIRNQILRDLAARDLEILLAQLTKVGLELKQFVHRVGQPIEHVYFVETGTVSMVTRMADGGDAEVGLVGREGFVGLPLLLGTPVASLDALVQVNGTAWRMTAEAFKQALASMPPLLAGLLRYVHLFQFQVSQTAACNARHPIEKRLARWILMTADRVEDDQFPMTQEFMSRMLAVQRSGVGQAIQNLHRTGLVQHQRTWLRVIDRPGLEAASCDCYRLVHDRFRTGPDETGKT